VLSLSLDILAITAHRDDVEQTWGGTLLKAARRAAASDFFTSNFARTQTALMVPKWRHWSAIGAFISQVLQTARTRGHDRLAMRSAA